MLPRCAVASVFIFNLNVTHKPAWQHPADGTVAPRHHKDDNSSCKKEEAKPKDSENRQKFLAILGMQQRRIAETRTGITGHGFRAMARTILHEELEQKPEVIEHQLAHTVLDKLKPNASRQNKAA